MSTERTSFRLKLNLTNPPPQVNVEAYISPVTPISQTGTLGAVEPAMSHMNSDLIVPLSDYKWNQIVEIQLADGKKV